MVAAADVVGRTVVFRSAGGAPAYPWRVARECVVGGVVVRQAVGYYATHEKAMERAQWIDRLANKRPKHSLEAP